MLLYQKAKRLIGLGLPLYDINLFLAKLDITKALKFLPLTLLFIEKGAKPPLSDWFLYKGVEFFKKQDYLNLKKTILTYTPSEHIAFESWKGVYKGVVHLENSLGFNQNSSGFFYTIKDELKNLNEMVDFFENSIQNPELDLQSKQLIYSEKDWHKTKFFIEQIDSPDFLTTKIKLQALMSKLELEINLKNPSLILKVKNKRI